MQESIHAILSNKAKRKTQDKHYKVCCASNTRRMFLDLLPIEIKKNIKSTTVSKRVLVNQAITSCLVVNGMAVKKHKHKLKNDQMWESFALVMVDLKDLDNDSDQKSVSAC